MAGDNFDQEWGITDDASQNTAAGTAAPTLPQGPPTGPAKGPMAGASDNFDKEWGIDQGEAQHAAETSPANKPTGYLHNIEAGLAEGLGTAGDMASGVVAAPYYALTGQTNPLIRPLEIAGGSLYDLAAPHVGLPQMSDATRNKLYGAGETGLGTRVVNGLSKAITGYEPGDVQAGSTGQQIARTVAQGVGAGAALGPAGETGVLGGALTGAAGALGGEGATSVAQAAGVPERYMPGVNLLGQLVAGGGGKLATDAALKEPQYAGTNNLNPNNVKPSGNGPSSPPTKPMGPAGTTAPGAMGPAPADLIPQSVDQAKGIASNYYDLAKKSNAGLSSNVNDAFISRVQQAAQESPHAAAMRTTSNPVATMAANLDSLRGRPLNFEDIQGMDTNLGQAIDAAYDSKGKLSADGQKLLKIQNDLRDTVQNAQPGDITGDAQGFQAWNTAKQAWAQAMKMNDLQRIFDRAQQMDVPATAIKTGIRNLLNSAKARGYTPEEIQAVKEAGDRGTLGTALHVFGSRLIPVAGWAAHGLLGAAVGHVASEALRNVGTRLQNNRMQNALNTVARGVPANPPGYPNPLNANP